MKATTHSYTTARPTAYESSLDVYLPPPSSDAHRTATHLVVLVVGSAWLGHLAPVYRPTSWWNASAPRTLARAGAVCVCVRHRGAFPPPPPLLALLALTAAAAAAAAALFPRTPLVAAICAAAGLVLLHLLWSAAARTSASHADMVEDVAQALAWVRRNRSLICDQPTPLTVTWFGGYSSGANVAASLLVQPDGFFIARGLPPPATGKLCDAVLHLSGVFGGGEARRPSSMYGLLGALVFGAGKAPAAPLANASRVPERLPHVLVRCAREAYGLPFVEWFMASVLGCREYADALRERGMAVRELELHSSHWTMLTDPQLLHFLSDEFSSGGLRAR